jgi:hypothetical protein
MEGKERGDREIERGTGYRLTPLSERCSFIQIQGVVLLLKVHFLYVLQYRKSNPKYLAILF